MNNNYSDTPIFLDYASTTPVDPRVVEAMHPYFSQIYGNTSSIHYYGQKAERSLENAREQLARCMNCQSEEIIFTSCGSESDNLAVRGCALAGRQSRGANHILTTTVEHHAVINTAVQMAGIHGFELEFLPVDQHGIIQPESVAERLRSDTALVSIIYANNEIGSINPITEIGLICRTHNIPFHTDAVQAAAYLPMDTQILNADLISIGAHKFYGPKGVGALYVRKGTPLIPSLTGGSQEFGLRAGTHNTPYIIGLVEAFMLVEQEREERLQKLLPLRARLIEQVLERIPASFLTGHPINRLPNHASFVFDGVDGNELLIALDNSGFAVSSGSACKTGNPEPSDVLLALGITPELAMGSLRVTLGNFTTLDHIDAFLNTLPKVIEQLRQL